MPIYEYKCGECSEIVEQHQSFTDPLLVKCPGCKKETLQRIISGGLGFSVKGGAAGSQAESLGGRYVPMDSTEQKFEKRMQELMGNGEL